MPFLNDQKNWRAPRPPPTFFFLPKSPDQNFEIAILFSIVKNILTLSLGSTYSSTVPGEGLQVTSFDQCLHTVMVNWKCTVVFRMIFFLVGGFRGGGATLKELFTLKYFTVLKSGFERKSQTLAQRTGLRGGNTPFHIRSNFFSFQGLMSLLSTRIVFLSQSAAKLSYSLENIGVKVIGRTP